MDQQVVHIPRVETGDRLSLGSHDDVVPGVEGGSVENVRGVERLWVINVTRPEDPVGVAGGDCASPNGDCDLRHARRC